MASQGIDGLGALADQKVAGAKHDRCGLRLLTFHGHEPHGGALSSLADRLSIGHVVLLPFDERLHVRRRDQLHRVAELGDLAAPVVSARAGLQGHRAGWKRCEERKELAAAQLLAKDHRARAVGSVQLKDVLGEIEADGAHLVHGRLLEWALVGHLPWGVPYWAASDGEVPHVTASERSAAPLERRRE